LRREPGRGDASRHGVIFAGGRVSMTERVAVCDRDLLYLHRAFRESGLPLQTDGEMGAMLPNSGPYAVPEHQVPVAGKIPLLPSWKRDHP